MSTLTQIIKELKDEHDRLASQLADIERAIAALNGIGNGMPRRRRGVRTDLSPAARRRIAAAQKARWVKWRKDHGK